MSSQDKPEVSPTRILGIDPGTRVMGYGVLEKRGEVVTLLAQGEIRLGGSLPSRLDKIYRDLRGILREYSPTILAMEDVFHGKNFQSVLKLGQARGVVLLAAQQGGLRIFEFAPAEVKKTTTGNGNADKTQVQKMVSRLLDLDELPGSTDASDALAVAYCCAENLSRERRFAGLANGGNRKPKGKRSKSTPSSRRGDLYSDLLRSGRARLVEESSTPRAKGARAGKKNTQEDC